MPHVLFAAPSIGSFHLHDRLAELAMRRGHRVSVLAGTPAERAFWEAQGLPVRPPVRGAVRDDPTLPLCELAEIDLCLRGDRGQRRAWQRRVSYLRAQAKGVLHAFAHDRPDAVLMHAGRSGMHRLVHFVARRAGVAVLHLGDGLLPGTLACDPEGADGDAALSRRSAADYRSTLADRPFLQATLAAWLGASAAPAALRRPPTVPFAAPRFLAALHAGWRHGPAAGVAAWHVWREALPQSPPPPRTPLPLPPLYVAVLLQSDACPRLRLDAPPGLEARALLATTRDALTSRSEHVQAVGIAGDVRLRRVLIEQGFRVEPEEMAAAVLATAMAVVTVNHPLAGGALLQGTPVVHLGRAVYGVPGVAVAGRLDGLGEALATALDGDRPSLRERFLTRILQRDHIWCSAPRPDRNGLNGIMQHLERLMPDAHDGANITYRPGPSWPLAAAR